MSSYTKPNAFWYRPDTPGDNDGDYTKTNAFWFRGPSSKTLEAGFEYVGPSAIVKRLATETLSLSDPTASLSRLATEALSTSDIPIYLERLAIEVLSPNTFKRRPKFFTFLID